MSLDSGLHIMGGSKGATSWSQETETLIMTLTFSRTGLPLKTRGSILNVASVAGSLAISRISPYVISKHGVLGLTKTDAKDYATEGIRVNAICPGWVKTEISKTLWNGPMASRSRYSKAFVLTCA